MTSFKNGSEVSVPGAPSPRFPYRGPPRSYAVVGNACARTWKKKEAERGKKRRGGGKGRRSARVLRAARSSRARSDPPALGTFAPRWRTLLATSLSLSWLQTNTLRGARRSPPPTPLGPRTPARCHRPHSRRRRRAQSEEAPPSSARPEHRRRRRPRQLTASAQATPHNLFFFLPAQKKKFPLVPCFFW